jgi:hypothetical protein
MDRIVMSRVPLQGGLRTMVTVTAAERVDTAASRSSWQRCGAVSHQAHGVVASVRAEAIFSPGPTLHTMRHGRDHRRQLVGFFA